MSKPIVWELICLPFYLHSSHPNLCHQLGHFAHDLLNFYHELKKIEGNLLFREDIWLPCYELLIHTRKNPRLGTQIFLSIKKVKNSLCYQVMGEQRQEEEGEKFQLKLQAEIKHIKDKLKLDFAKEVGGLEVGKNKVYFLNRITDHLDTYNNIKYINVKFTASEKQL
jgi:hypothetical protein